MPLFTILIEDNEAIRNGLIPALAELAGAEVIAVAESAAAGIAALQANGDRWQLAVVDMFLKGGNGLDVLRASRDRSPHQRMLVLTNYATADMRRRAIDAGADGVYDKSTEIEVFFERCRSLAGGQDGQPS